MRTILQLGWQALLAVPIHAAEPEMVIQKTAGGVRFARWGEKPAKPAPTLFIFAVGLEDMRNAPVFTEVGQILAKRGFLYVALDPPCHGEDVKPKEPAALQGWRHRLEHGNGLIPPFTKAASEVLDQLVREGFTDASRVAACGTSRGGFLAYHFAAADPRIKAVAGFSPVTNLLALTEFAGLEKHEATKALTLIHHADKLAGRAVWLSIGNHDERVSTDDAIAFARKVTAASAATQKNKEQAIPVELIVGESVGHRGIPKAHQFAAEWIAKHLGPAAK